MARLLASTCATLPPGARLHRAAEDDCCSKARRAGADLPVWVPRSEAGLREVHIACALHTGLACRPLAQTVADTAAWRQRAA